MKKTKLVLVLYNENLISYFSIVTYIEIIEEMSKEN